MQIGTAAPTPEELQQAKHHFIHHKSIHESYNVGAFEKDAIKKLNTLFKTHNIVILVGGSGLYSKDCTCSIGRARGIAFGRTKVTWPARGDIPKSMSNSCKTL